MSDSEDRGSMLTLRKASEKCKVKRQAIYIAIKKGQIKAVQNEKKRWYMWEKDVDDYRITKYSRDKSTFNGAPLYDPANEEMGVGHVAKMLGIDKARVYYLARKGEIPHTRKGTVYVFKRADIVKAFEEKPADPNQQVMNI